ncbi:hypothetical protein AURDEDRAFT_109650 [Auricularia subglabra TFB-10046 SS5]|nr:hypothetical protein AURDEDRAFT_109650 [Auricularia subglabra TFB-10046 SS5]
MHPRPRSLAVVLSAASGALAAASSAANVVPTIWQNQSFFFSWDQTGVALPTPVTKQCDSIPITWNRGAATGPDPQAPYELHVFTSIQTSPLILTAEGASPSMNFTVPFPVDTQYQICMFDNQGATGGCQAVYTVVDGSTRCANEAPDPPAQLQVSANYSQGLLSRYGWPDQCTDITVTPQGGKPPYTFMVAPALHPPTVYTSHNTDPITWKVSLSWGSPFFLSLTDSSDPPLSWAHGPLHAGGNGGTACLDTNELLAVNNGGDDKKGVSVGVPIGTLIAGLFVGALLGFFVPFFIRRHHERNRTHLGGKRTILMSDDGHVQLGPPGRTNSEVTPYTMEPYRGGAAATTPRSVTSAAPRDAYSPSHHSATFPGHHTQLSTSSGGHGGTNQVYVIHQDAGRPPVSVIVAGSNADTQVQELPPMYAAPGGAERPYPREKGRRL